MERLCNIFSHFPDSDAKYKDADSLKLLQEVGVLLRNKGFEISHIDSVVIAEEPKMSPYRKKMRENIAEALHLKLEQVNLKATTEEGLGFTGTKQGIAAWAVVTVIYE